MLSRQYIHMKVEKSIKSALIDFGLNSGMLALNSYLLYVSNNSAIKIAVGCFAITTAACGKTVGSQLRKRINRRKKQSMSCE